MGTDGDGYNWCGNGWEWVNFPLPCRSLIQNQGCNWLSRVLPEKWPLKQCSCVWVCVHACLRNWLLYKKIFVKLSVYCSNYVALTCLSFKDNCGWNAVVSKFCVYFGIREILKYICWQVSETSPSKDDAVSTPSQQVVGLGFIVHNSIYAIARICYRPSVCLSVCHTDGSVKNAWSWDHATFTIE